MGIPTKVKFNNGTTFHFHWCEESEHEFALGAERETVWFECSPEELDGHTIDELDSLLSVEETTKYFELIDEDPLDDAGQTVFPRKDYVLNLGISSRNEMISNSPSASPEVRRIITIKLGKRTYLENQLKALGLPVASTETAQ